MPYPAALRDAPTPPFNGTEACARIGSALFFDAKTTADVDQARTMCAACPMLATCDEWALAREEFGFWAGRTAAERNQIRKNRGIVLHRPEARGVRKPNITADRMATAA